MIPVLLIGGGAYLIYDALVKKKPSFDPLDYGLPTKGFRGYRKGAAHFANGGMTPKFKVLDRVRMIPNELGNYSLSSGTISSVIPPNTSRGDTEFQYEVIFDGERDEHSLMESDLVSDEPKASMIPRDRYGFFAKGGETNNPYEDLLLKKGFEKSYEIKKDGFTEYRKGRWYAHINKKRKQVEVGKYAHNWSTADIKKYGGFREDDDAALFPMAPSFYQSDRYTNSFSKFQKFLENNVDEGKMENGGLIGKRIRLIKMENDPNPVEPGTMGTIKHVGGGVYNVDWDNGRRLGVVEGEDEFEIVN